MFVRSRPALVWIARSTLCAALLAGCSKTAEPPRAPAPALATAPPAAAWVASGVPEHAPAGIAWTYAANDVDVDAAFASARAASKPVFVYWGAKWCPPCNQVKATLFNRQDFIERSRAFVPVYVDGDSPGAQKLGARFKVSGYPTMVLFSPTGTELTRLPGEVDGERYTDVLTLGMNAQRPVKELLAQVEHGGATLNASDWRLLAFYSWDTDQQQLVSRHGLPALLKRLARACPPEPKDVAVRLQLKALAAVDEHAPHRADPAQLAAVMALLSDEAGARAQMDVLTNNAADITQALTLRSTAPRAQLLAAFDAALRQLEADATLSRADRINALIAQVDLARIDVPKSALSPANRHALPALPAALLADIREQAARADREITDGYERQSVITAVAYLLEAAGLDKESDALLQANLARSHSPYYLMSELAGNAKARGDKAQALHWYDEAFRHSEGPATRLQWGASYVSALIELSPHDEARIESAAAGLLGEAASQPDAFYERSGRSLQRMGRKLADWNRGAAPAAALGRLQARLDAVCGALPAADPSHAACLALLKPSTQKSA